VARVGAMSGPVREERNLNWQPCSERKGGRRAEENRRDRNNAENTASERNRGGRRRGGERVHAFKGREKSRGAGKIERRHSEERRSSSQRGKEERVPLG